jgi:hypothetical protein
MRVLLQQKDNGLYFQDPDLWTADALQAKDFITSTAAIDFCVAQRFKGVQMVFKFDQQHYDIVLPVITTRSAAGGHIPLDDLGSRQKRA